VIMTDIGGEFEVEIRCHFDNVDKVYRSLPFVRRSLQHEMAWSTRIYGLALFKSGYLLRASEVSDLNGIRHYLGWKGTDIGRFANIRHEISEECTHGITNSAIMKVLGGNDGSLTHEAAIREYERLGHREFMSFQGYDAFGYDKTLGIHIKLMFCQTLKWPLLVELEKTALTEAAARRCEEELRQLSLELHLKDYLVRDEPPTLLYDRFFS
jgi:hypothetical protein